MSEFHENAPTSEVSNPDKGIYWQTLEQWNQDPEFQKRAETEFASSPIREGESESQVERRDFLKLMGASIALASSACVRRPVQKIVPYSSQPEEVTFGAAQYYTSTWFDGSEPFGVLVRTREGRPLKIEGNPSHPVNKGGLSARAQAHILSLYDPERLQKPKRNLLNKERTNRDTISVTWDDADKSISDQLKKGGVAVLTGNIASPSTRAVVSDFCQGFKARHFIWEPLAADDVRNGQRLSYGDDSVPNFRFDLARVIVSIDADFLGTWLSPVAFTKQFSQGRKNLKAMNRLVAFDSAYSLTGANADLRFRIRPSQQVAVVLGLAHEIIVKKGRSKFAGNGSVQSALAPYAQASAQIGISAEQFSAIADSLWENKGQSLVVAGGPAAQTESSSALQVAVNLLNSALENDGQTVQKSTGNYLKATNRGLVELKEAMLKGEIKTLILNKTNPIYSAPASLGFEAALKKVEMVISTSGHLDETSRVSHFVLPESHVLESWGDLEFSSGLVSLQQPTIRALYDTRSFQLSLMTWAFMNKVGPERIQKFETFYDYLRNHWKESVHPALGKGMGFEDFWDKALQAGFISSGTQSSHSGRAFKVEALSSLPKSARAVDGLELVLHPSVQLGDGTLANVSWLQELPDPVTKIVWDNVAMLSIALAQNLKLKQGDIISVSTGDHKIEIPVLIQPGLHDQVVAIAVGYGRSSAGKVGSNIGVNAFPLVSTKGTDGQFIFSGQKVTIEATGKKVELATTSGHHYMSGKKEGERKIVAEANYSDYMQDQHAGNHRHKIFSIWSGHQYNGHKWGMAVDLNTCTGCSACVVACQSENNIPVVGKKYVLQSREMHWMRIDRYYVGDPENASAVFQPVMCQHCDNAPCETVCPVLATVHSSEGLNDMAYNRCVGTRYCANNCPYKVRRFNWFHYTKNIEKPLHLALNPEVTVRVRGVMEKCTFCVQRIKAAKNKVKVEKRNLVDGDVKTACQQSCPSDAIVFGDLNDPKSEVAQIFQNEPRAYGLLEEFNAAPSVRYLTKIRNNGKSAGPGHAHSEKGEHS